MDGPFGLVAALKAVVCMDDQSCEHSEGERSEACALLELLRSEVLDLRPELGEEAVGGYGETVEQWLVLPEVEKVAGEVETAGQVVAVRSGVAEQFGGRAGRASIADRGCRAVANGVAFLYSLLMNTVEV